MTISDPNYSEQLAEFNRRLNLSFSTPSLLLHALTFKSYTYEHADASEDNERLEFLGDAVLDLIVAEWAYHHFPELPEGDLTKIRARIVRNENLAQIAKQINLSEALRLGYGEKTSSGDLRESILGSAFEALLGAIYLDSNIENVKIFLLPFINPLIETILEEINDPTSQLHEKNQGAIAGEGSIAIGGNVTANNLTIGSNNRLAGDTTTDAPLPDTKVKKKRQEK